MSVSCGHCKTRTGRVVYHDTTYEVYTHSPAFQQRQSYRQVAAPPAPAPQPERPVFTRGAYPFKVPQVMVENIKDGRYAVDVGVGTQRVVFLRVSRPTRGKYAGSIKIQTQHSDAYLEAIVKYPSGYWWVSNRIQAYKSSEIEQALATIAVNPLDAAMLYSKEKGVCCNCGKTLTDERSRWYGIGPDCETRRQDIINAVHNSKGYWRG